jgi:hypothetical protein
MFKHKNEFQSVKKNRQSSADAADYINVLLRTLMLVFWLIEYKRRTAILFKVQASVVHRMSSDVYLLHACLVLKRYILARKCLMI